MEKCLYSDVFAAIAIIKTLLRFSINSLEGMHGKSTVILHVVQQR